VTNSAIADKALTYVGRWGGAACVDAGFSGATGGVPLGDADNADGECRAFVNCIVKMTTGQNVAFGNDDYQRAFREGGGQPISPEGGMKGDIIQVGNGIHTAIVVANLGARTYQVVDANWGAERHKVSVHDYTVPDGGQIWRMGTARIAIRSAANGKYVSTELGYGGNDYGMARARSGGVGGWERFSVLGDCARNCALRSEANGKFLVAELGYQGYAWGEIRARSDQASGWEQFRFSGSCDTGCGIIALASGKYLTTEIGYTGNGYGMLRARGDSPGGWERYTITY
jgi:hypothetical protein